MVKRLLRLGAGWVLLGALAGLLAALATSLRHAPVYQATATVLVISALSGNEAQPADQRLAGDLLQTYRLTIKSSPVLSEVRGSLHWSFMALADLATKIDVNPVPETNLLTITAYADTGDDAARLANTVATTFIARAAQERVAPRTARVTELTTRLADDEAALAAALLRQATLRAQPTRSGPETAELGTLAAAIPGYEQTRRDLRATLTLVQQEAALDLVPARLVSPAAPPPAPVAVRGVLSLSMAALAGGLAAGLLLALVGMGQGPFRRGARHARQNGLARNNKN